MPDSNVVATAKYGYTITWKNGDNELKSDVVAIGETPSYSGETPTKAADTTCPSYAFDGWTSSAEAGNVLETISPVGNQDASYYAHFSCLPTVTIKFVRKD
jgi:uncharacterized repeat protein (TIGR02543 family)